MNESVHDRIEPTADGTAISGLLDSIVDYAIFRLGADGRIETWNRGAVMVQGYDAPEIVGANVSRLYTEDDVTAGIPGDHLKRAAADGRYETEGWRVRKDGSRFWANEILSAVRRPDGALEGFAKVTRDVTIRRLGDEQRRLSEERFRLLVERVRDYAIFMLSKDGTIITWNGGAEHIKGYRADEVLGKHFSCFYPDEEGRDARCAHKLVVAAREGRCEDEGWRVRKDGTQFWANVVITPLHDPTGQLVGFAKVTRDLTEQRKLEAEKVRRSHAEDTVRLRDEFLSVASHELKTPLTALQLQLQSLQRGVQDDERAQKKLDRAVSSGRRLSDLIEGLLDVSRIATGRFELQRTSFDLAELVRDAVERARVAADKADCSITLHAATPVVGSWDRKRLEQAFGNVLANAIKYAAGTALQIRLSQRDNRAWLEVEDEGPGIPEADLGRIFDRFERAASLRHYGGMGLGLYVTRQIIEAHSGEIAAVNKPGGGTRFSMQFPLPASERPAALAMAGVDGAR